MVFYGDELKSLPPVRLKFKKSSWMDHEDIENCNTKQIWIEDWESAPLVYVRRRVLFVIIHLCTNGTCLSLLIVIVVQ